MSSRFPPSGRGDPRYTPRDRSPPRYPERRPSGPHGSAPLSARGNNDFLYRANDTYAHSAPRREPPRGPKAFGVGPGRGYGSRGRGFRGRGDGIAREYRDARDISAGRREQDNRDWAWRDREPSRERRPSPVGRNRSRSPAPRDFRDSREFGPRDIEHERSRRNSREGFAQPSPAASDPPLSAGPGNRGGFFGRGRSDWDYNRRSRGSFGEDREPFRIRSRSREQPWERRSMDDRDRDWASKSTRKDERRDEKREWDDRDREAGRAARDPFTNRPEPGGTISARSASTSPPPKYRHSATRPSHDARSPDSDSIQRPSNTSTDPSEPLPPEGSNRLGMGSYQGRELPLQRTSSPPQAPQVPAFGSIVYQKPLTDPSTEAPAQKNENVILPASSQPLQSMANVPSAPKAQLINVLPTGPKADQNSARRPIPDTVTASNRWTDGRGSNVPGSPHGPISEVSSIPTGSVERFNVATKEFRAGQSPQQMPFSRAANFVSPIKSSDDTNRYSGNPAHLSVGNPSRSSVQEPPTQSSPIRIPTGPRADRAAPASKPPVSSPGRLPPGRPTMLQRPSRGTNLRWVRPGLPTHTPRGPSIMSPMAVKKDYAEDDTTGSLDGESEEQEATLLPASSVTKQPPSPKVISPDHAKTERQGPLLVEQQNDQLLISKFGEDSKTSETLLDHGKAEEKDTVMEDEHMDLDEEYLADERKFQHQILLLEMKRPASPRQNTKLLSLLDEIDALSSAAEDRANGSAVHKIEQEPTDKARLNAYPSPKIVEDDPFQDNPILSHQEFLRNATPPVDSLPYLMSGPPTPFSEVDLQDQSDLQEILDAQLMDELTSRLRLESNDHEEVKEQFYQNYKAWRLAVEDWEDRKAATAPSVPVTPAPMSTPLIPTMPITEGRRSARNVSELDFERAIRDSIAIADEEQQRRDQEAKSSINPEKEAIIPDMLNDYEIRTQSLVDTTNLIKSSDAYSVFGYVPKPNDLTAEEQEIYTEAFLTSPKKFGAIAKALPNRTYQDCIRHYYLTKHEQQYKEKLATRLKKGRRAPARSTGRPRGGAPSLLSNAMVDEKHQIEVTDTGRPRRAAAPTFGDSTETEASTPAVTPGRRNMSGTKADGSEANPEKPPTRRGRGGTTREKVPRKPKAQLLAAAPGPSPQKVEKETPRGKSKEPKIEIEQQIDETEAGELLANLQHNQNVPAFTQQPMNEIWTGGQPIPVSGVSQIQVAKPDFTAQEQLQSQQRAGPSTSSYWSVPEQTDFSNLLHHFGTNWQAIADHMKTKTQTMVKNYYHRQVERGDRRAMEEAALAANEKIKRGEDMGQPPPPTLVPKRRYDTGPQIVPPRPLAPSVEANEVGRESSNLQLTKPTKLSPPQFDSSPQKLSALAQAEPLPRKLLHETETQPTIGSTMLSETQPQQQRASQGLQGPRVGFFANDRPQPMLQPQPAAMSQLQQPPPPTRQQQQADSRSQKPVTDQTRLRNLQEMLQIQDRSISQDQSPSARYQPLAQTVQQPLLHQGAGNNRQINVPSQVRIAPSYTAEVDIRPRVATHQQSQSRHPSHHDQRQEQQRMDNPSTTRRPDAYGAPRHTQLQSPVKPRLPSNFSPSQDTARPNSVPAPPPAQQPPKRSNIMSILNDEPAEPQARKRISDSRPAAPTPPPQSPAGQTYHQPVQPYVRREAPTTEPQHPLQQYHQRPSLGQIASQHPAQQPREGPSNWATVAQRTSLERQPHYQQQRAESPRLQPAFTQQASRASLPSIPRSHAPTPPPPFGHSRASSFASLQSQQTQQQPQPSAQATPVLQPSPYAQIHPQQSMHPQHHHQHSQHQHQTQQAPTQPQQQQTRGSGPPSLFHHQYMRHQEALQQQQQHQQQHQQQQHQQGAPLQRQPEASRSDILQYQDNLRMVQARNQANEQARRDEAAGRTFTPPVYGRHGGYGPPQNGPPRGYEDRR